MDDFSGLAMRVTVTTSSDDYTGRSMTNPTVPNKFKPLSKKERITIGRHAIIGTGAVVLPGAMIAEGVALGALSTTSMPTDPWALYQGIPAKKIMERSKHALELEKAFLAEK